MAKKDERIQVCMRGDLKDAVLQYQAERQLTTQSSAIIELVEFALRIKNNAKEDDSISNRELLEEILNHVLVTEKVSRSAYGHAYIKGKLKDEELVREVKGIVAGLENQAEIQKNSILKKE